MGFFDSWKGLPIICWAYDTPEAWQDAITKSRYEDELKDYSSVYDRQIAPIIFDLGMKFNLGGEQEKSRLETTSRPIGVFDFSLASQGLYRVQEYYSAELAKDHPNLFSTFELPDGVVPPNLVENIVIGGIKNFVYTHEGKTYVLDKRQKGTTALNDGVKDAKLKFATTTKDVYLKFKRMGGKVKYAEIYSLFYFTSLDGNDEYAIRHFPALITAQYFESIGIKTRVYMTRFVDINTNLRIKRNDLLTGQELPMYTQIVDARGSNRADECVIFAPIIVKDFGQDLDWKSCLAVSQEYSGNLYEPIVRSMIPKECDNTFSPYGDPDTTQERYLEAFARYREKYQLYVKSGIWKSKEIQEDSQLFFHSESIRSYLSYLRNNLGNIVASELRISASRWNQILTNSSVVRKFFEWWMLTCAGRTRDMLMLMNSKEPRKEMQKIIDDMKTRNEDILSFLSIQVPQIYNDINVPQNNLEQRLAKFIMDKDFISLILAKEGLTKNLAGEYNYENYLNRIIKDSTTYASGLLFPTPEDTIERLDERAELLFSEIKLRN
jgi:hypothetical protein